MSFSNSNYSTRVTRKRDSDGKGAVIVRAIAGTDISALRVVYEEDGLIYPLSYDDADNVMQLLGIAVTGGIAGTPIEVQRYGKIEDSGWSWALGRIWLGLSGALTQVAPADNFDVLIADAVSPTEIVLNIQDPIEWSI